MLKNIPKIISPDLMKILMEMGHGDEVVIADGNFPAAANAKRLLRCDGHGVPELLRAIMKFFPLDTHSNPVSLMAVSPEDNIKPDIWQEYKAIIKESEPNSTEFNLVERFEFYERARNAYAVVATSEAALYANIILKKGVVQKEET